MKSDLIFEFLKTQSVPQTPTMIGLAFGKTYNNASGWANDGIKKLLKEGKIKAVRKGLYTLTEPVCHVCHTESAIIEGKCTTCHYDCP